MVSLPRPRFDSQALLWLGVVLFVALAIAFLLPVTPQDYWWYVRLGRDILSNHAIPQVDTFTFTRAGTPVDYQSWGAAVMFWLLLKAGGLTLTIFARGVILGGSCWLVWLTARRAGAGKLSAALALAAAVLASSNNWSMRPQLFAYPLFAVSLYILYRWQAGGNKGLVALPFISLVWVNLHGSFVMLILLTGAALVFGRGKRRWLALAFAGILLATLANPRGFGAWGYVFSSLTAPSSQQFSGEWLPPVNRGWQMNIFFLWLLGFPFLAHLSKHKFTRLEWTWFLGFGFLALLGLRYVVWFIFILVPLTAVMLTEWEQRYVREAKTTFPAVNLALAALFMILPLALLPGVREKWWSGAPPATSVTPVEAAEWLADHPQLEGPLWSEIGFSSYLEYRLPERPTWIDTRFEVFPVKQWQLYEEITDARFNWEDLLKQTGAKLLLLSKQDQAGLIDVVENSPRWCALYRDDVAVLYRQGNCEGDE